MHTSSCLEAKEGDFSKHKHLKPAGKAVPWQWFGAQVLCSAVSPSPSGLLSVAELLEMLCMSKKLSVSGINLEQLYFSVVTSLKTVHCST